MLLSSAMPLGDDGDDSDDVSTTADDAADAASGVHPAGVSGQRVAQSFASMGVITLVWFLFGFSLAFGPSLFFVGSPHTFAAFKNVGGVPFALPGVDAVGNPTSTVLAVA